MTSSAILSTPTLLVLGGPSSGKTTYRAQICQRIEHHPGALKLVKSVGDLTAIEGDVELLLQGMQPRHTSVNTYHSTTFAVEDRSGHRFVLEFADYGGEQLRRMAHSNYIPGKWVERAQQADRWLFFLRIDSLRSAKSFMTDPVAAGPRSEAQPETTATGDSSEVSGIETLQRLLFVRGVSWQRPLAVPRLAVFLSCWDELPKPEQVMSPAELLERRAPMLSRFIKATWQSENHKIWGLSSTEQRLPETGGNEEFARKGPQHFGYVVLDDGQHERDLTAPLSWLMYSK